MLIPILGFIILGSCSQKIEVIKLLDNSETRSEIFEAIARDHDRMASFMESIQGNHMMMGKMIQMMNLEGIMSNECMQAMQEIMSDKD